uniref:Tyrosine specific protein phosphatases domain-containing protein n=1 Tax=Trypanosoma congolense (strain IL3000) TaxID=1068625 RepID=G0V046_TRYCI|nr:conserved hypothetical protein [Trypanosoma congolense IL3000]
MGNEKYARIARGLRLASGNSQDHLADISDAVNCTFFRPEYGCTAPVTGSIFLTSAAAAESGNLTDKMLFREGASSPESTTSDSSAASNAVSDRWIRGVVVASDTLQMPQESVFLHEDTNGRLLFCHVPQMRMRLCVVGVPLPSYVAGCKYGFPQESVMGEHRKTLEERERSFLRDLQRCLLSLMGGWLTDKETGAGGHSLKDGSAGGTCDSDVDSTLKEARPSDNGDVLTLTVPIYYLHLCIRDNASSRIGEYDKVATNFMQLIIDGVVSVVRRTTAILQGLVFISNMMQSVKPASSMEMESELQKIVHDALAALYHCTELLLRGGGEEQRDGKDLLHSTFSLASIVALEDTEFEKYSFLANVSCSLPSVLVHCLKGVSRSPSIVMAFYMRTCAEKFYMLSKVLKGLEGATSDADALQSSNISSDDIYVFSFPHLLQCLRRARPVVNPQICFLAELRSMWMGICRGQEGTMEH